MFNMNSSSKTIFDITDIGYIERIVVGTTDPGEVPSQNDTQAKMELLNRCLSESPKGKVIGIERSFSIIRIGEHQVVLESIIYHIGFKREPLWIQALRKSKQSFSIDPCKVDSLINNL